MTVLAAEGFVLGPQAGSQVGFHSSSIYITKMSPDKLFCSVFCVNGGVKSYSGISEFEKHEVHESVLR